MARLRIAVIGAGAWGANHVRVVASEPSCELAAIVDRDPDALVRAAAVAPGPTLRDPDIALADRSIDAVIIATPASTHVPLACAAIAAGKHVLVEKPLALSLADTERLAAVRADGVVMLGHQMVFHPALVRARELLHAGELGELHYVHSIRANLGRIRSDEGALWTFGPHELSMLDVMLDAPAETVSARGQCVVHPGVEDVAFVTIRYATGKVAHLHLSRLHPRKERTFTLVCSRKLACFDDVGAHKLRIYDKPYDHPPHFTQFADYLSLADGALAVPQLGMVEPLRLQLQHFVACVRTGAIPRTDLASGVRIARVLEAARRSLALDGQPVTCNN